MSKIEVPAEAYQAFSRGEISQEELVELEKFAEDLAEKVAFFGKDPGRNAAMLGGMALAAPGLAYVGAKGPELAERALSSMTFNRDFNRVLSVNPQLGDAEDPNLRMAFKTLRTLNPTYSKDPLIAGTILDGVMQNRMDPDDPSSPPRYDPALVGELVTGASKMPLTAAQEASRAGAANLGQQGVQAVGRLAYPGDMSPGQTLRGKK